MINAILMTHLTGKITCRDSSGDKMFKTRERFMAKSSSESNTIGICSFEGNISRESHEGNISRESHEGNISRESHETDFKCVDEVHISLSKTSSAEHRITHDDTITDLVVLGLPVFNVKGEPSEENGSKNVSEKKPNNSLKVSTRSVSPIKLEPKSFENNESEFAHEIFFCNGLNTSEQSALQVKIKAEPPEEAETRIAFEKYIEKLSNFSQLRCPINNIRKEIILHSSISKEVSPTCCNLSNKIHIPEDLNIPSTEILSAIISDLDKSLSGITGSIIQHPEKNDIVYDCLLKGNGNFPIFENYGCFNQSSYLQNNFHAGEPHSNPILLSSSLKDKPESVESCQTYRKISSCNNRGQIFENKKDLSSDLPVDILDHVPLKYRLGTSELHSDFPLDILDKIPLRYRLGSSKLQSDFPLNILDNVPLKHRLGSTAVSEVSVNIKSENNFLEEIPPETSGCCSFGSINNKASHSFSKRKSEIASVTSGSCSFESINTKASFSSSRKKRKKTATDSVEKAMEEDAPGLLQVLIDRGIQVEEIKLYGGVEDDDSLEEISSKDGFEEFESLMTKLFFERSSVLRFTLGRSVKGSRTVYCLASLISLIEQCRYSIFCQTPVEWGWCRDLRSFIFVFKTHNRIVLERPEYGYATYFFELVCSLPIDWQIKRLVMAMKLTNCSRTILLENKPLIVGEDLSEGEACVLEEYGWSPNTGIGTMLNYCDRVVHDRRKEMYNVDWRAKIGKLLINGHDGGRLVLTKIPKKATEYMGSQNPEMKLDS